MYVISKNYSLEIMAKKEAFQYLDYKVLTDYLIKELQNQDFPC